MLPPGLHWVISFQHVRLHVLREAGAAAQQPSASCGLNPEALAAAVQVLVSCQLLTEAEMEGCIDTEFNPTHVAFRGGRTIQVEDCLNLGVSPR